MKDIARLPLSRIDDAASAGIRLRWRRLDRLESAATLGLVLASPRTALLMARTFGPRIPPLAPARSRPAPATRRPVVDR
jgi:hypothetical protein